MLFFTFACAGTTPDNATRLLVLSTQVAPSEVERALEKAAREGVTPVSVGALDGTWETSTGKEGVHLRARRRLVELQPGVYAATAVIDQYDTQDLVLSFDSRQIVVFGEDKACGLTLQHDERKAGPMDAASLAMLRSWATVERLNRVPCEPLVRASKNEHTVGVITWTRTSHAGEK